MKRYYRVAFIRDGEKGHIQMCIDDTHSPIRTTNEIKQWVEKYAHATKVIAVIPLVLVREEIDDE